MNDFEDWEIDYELTEQEDWEGLVKWRKSKFDKNPDEHYNQYYYGNALIHNGEFQKAIEILTKAHYQFPESLDITHCLLDTLFKSGKSEKDFQWKYQPRILRLNNETLDLCINYLKNKKKHRTIYDIYSDLLMNNAYLKFTENELFEFLFKAGKFDIIKEGTDYLSDIKFFTKKTRKKASP